MLHAAFKNREYIVKEDSMKKIFMILLVSLFLSGCNQKTDATEEGVHQSVTEEDNLHETETVSVEWIEKTIEIPELQNDYEVWFLSDLHITKVNDTESEEIRNYAETRTPIFTNEMGVDSAEILAQFIEDANVQKPDIVLFGGDILDFPSKANMDFLKEELDKLTVPYLFVMGNHDWTYPWEYMTPEGAEKYRPLVEEIISADTYANVIELDDIVFLAVDNSSNQVAPEAVEAIEHVYSLDKPIVLLQHVPFSTENLIARAKADWENPVTLGMQVHGGLAPNEISADLYQKVLDAESKIRVVLAGHVHFPYEEQISDTTVELISDAGYKGTAMKIQLSTEKHEYFCDKFMLTVDDKQYDLTELEPDLSSVSALQPIANQQLYILGRIDENNNMLLVYDFKKDEFVFHEQGVTMCWIQNNYESARYLKDDVVYDLEGNVIYQPDSEHTVSMIEYVDTDFLITVTDLQHQNPKQVWSE